MRKVWTSEEIKVIREMYPDCLTEKLLPFLPDRTVTKINSKAALLGVKKSALFFSKPESGRISSQNDIGKNTRYEKNCPGWNKGKKQADYMAPEAIERTKANRFKKGQDPHNTMPIGHERISLEGYVEVKVRHLKDGKSNNKNFELKHRLIYEKNVGPIPIGMIVEFLDGDKFNYEVSNLVLSSRKENLIRNTMCDSSIVKRFMKIKDPAIVAEMIANHPELINVQRNIIKLKSKLNERNSKKIN